MKIPIVIESNNGHVDAHVLGAPEFHATASTREQALALVRRTLAERVRRGDLVFLDLQPGGITGLAGIFADDPTLQDICDEAYRQRDAEIVE